MAEQFFWFSGREKVEKTMRDTWAQLRSQLKDGILKYDDIESALETTFIKVLDSLLRKNDGEKYLIKSLDKLIDDYYFIRGAVIQKGEPFPNYERMLPKSEFIRSDNRFSPKGVEWLYLALGNKSDSDGRENAIQCAQLECRVKKGDQFAVCELQYNSSGLKVIDLTTANSIPFDTINASLEDGTQKIIHEAAEKKRIELQRKYGSPISNASIQTLLKMRAELDATKKELITENNRIEELSNIIKWSVFTYAKMLSEQIFVPVDSEDKELMYAPFHCIAQYFLSLGYSGIVYKSTVYDKGKNLVLFDKTLVELLGDIKLDIIS